MIQCPQCHEHSAICIGGSVASGVRRYTYMCSNSECVFRWSQLRVSPGEDADVRPTQRQGAYCCGDCYLPKRDPNRESGFAHICPAYTLGFNKVLTRMIGGHSKFEQPACRAVYLSKRLAALQRIFRASLYAVRLMPRRKRLLTALFALRNIDGDVRHKIMQMAGFANFRTSFSPYTLWDYNNRPSPIAQKEKNAALPVGNPVRPDPGAGGCCMPVASGCVCLCQCACMECVTSKCDAYS
jgi:hypothetical protein